MTGDATGLGVMPIAGRGAMGSSARPPKGGLRLASAFLVIGLAPALAAPDSRRTPPPASCDLETVASGTVQSVTDGRTFILVGGQEVRLPAVEIPPLPVPSAAAPPPAPAPAESPAATP